jgi:uncharacterized protein YyaL (SSP411 family)
MRAPEGGFYSAQDADSDGVEGKYYVFTPDELTALLGQEDGERFCRYFDITANGNFEGKSIPNRLMGVEPDDGIAALLPKVYEFRKSRTSLHTDKKILTAWNALAAAAYAMAARILKDEGYLRSARETLAFMENHLSEGETLCVGVSDGKRAGPGFLDDYAFYIFALIQMHQATQDESCLRRASALAGKTIDEFWDGSQGGFFFSGTENETLIFRPKESYDGAMPSGNSVMAYNLARLASLTGEERFSDLTERQRDFMNGESAVSPVGYAFYLYSALPIREVVCALKKPEDLKALSIKSDWTFRVVDSPQYPLLNDLTTFYVCENGTCRPPANNLS